MLPTFKVLHGDCRQVMAKARDNGIDAIVTDPPYELGFMGKGWDRSGIAYDPEVWKQALRVLKPGGLLLAFGGTRTYHRMACAIEDAGFTVRDCLQWIYGSGFPKSKDISKALDKAAGATREVVGLNHYAAKRTGQGKDGTFDNRGPGLGGIESAQVTAPATDLARQWDGWGTALKPAYEIIVAAQKPLVYVQDHDIIVANLLEREGQLWSLLPANAADDLSKSRPAVYADAACASVPWTADERQHIRAALSDQMDTSRCVSVLTTCLNTVWLWKTILDDLCSLANTSTTETGSSLTTDLKTLKSCLLHCTPLDIIRAGTLADGSGLNALPVGQAFNAAALKLNATRTLSAVALAMSQGRTLPLDVDDLSPAYEPIILAQKPLEGTYAANVTKWGVGGLNIAGSRIGYGEGEAVNLDAKQRRNNIGGNGYQPGVSGGAVETDIQTYKPGGRWPANVLLDEAAAEMLDAQSGDRPGGNFPKQRSPNAIYGGGKGTSTEQAGGPRSMCDSGGASRFFYVAKASRADRDYGCDELPIRSAGEMVDRDDDSAGINNPRAGAGRTGGARNFHPTVKPLTLMRYLVRMITPPGGTVLDMFAGSGSTGVAAVLEGFGWVGIELTDDYLPIIRARVGKAYADTYPVEASDLRASRSEAAAD